jgi:inorganic pyrophosphatase
MSYWAKIDQIISSHEIVIDRPKGSTHPQHPGIVYPFDYGYLKDTSGGDGNEIDVCRGTLGETRLVAVICTVDIRKQDAEIKLLIDCTENEINTVDRFFNSHNFMSGIVIRRTTTLGKGNRQSTNSN